MDIQKDKLEQTCILHVSKNIVPFHVESYDKAIKERMVNSG